MATRPFARSHGIYHKLVKTTPKPSATKNSKGELVGPPPPLPLPVVAVGSGEVATGEDEVVVADMMMCPR